jgi:triosephosphate isomerase (TIM)
MANKNRGLLLAGNWKMYKTRAEAQAFVADLAPQLPILNGVEAMICPTFTLLPSLVELLKQRKVPVSVSAQTMASVAEGAFTGEVSPTQLKDLDIRGVILGHSERRQYDNETDASVNAKTKSALQHGLMPIVCVGETLAEREAGQTDAIVVNQITKALECLASEQVPGLVIAYEPVWAIGTGKVCETPEANRVCGVIRRQIEALYGHHAAQAVRILYGGSMKPDNAQGLLRQTDIDGGLVGGASLQVGSYLELITIANTIMTEQLVASV